MFMIHRHDPAWINLKFHMLTHKHTELLAVISVFELLIIVGFVLSTTLLNLAKQKAKLV